MKKLVLAAALAAASGLQAQAADLGSPRTPIAAAVVSPAFNWTGFYLGANVGYGVANTNLNPLTGGFLPGSGGGLVFGGQFGYNYQFNSFVIGAEADLGYFRVNRSAFQNPTRTTWQTSGDASVRLRAGVAVDRTLFYATGGLAFADLRIFAAHNGVIPVGGAERQTRVGWPLGAGIEHALTQNWTVRGEYRYANYGSRTIFGVPGVRLETHKVTLGVNYLFSTGPSAVVARY